MPANAAVMKEHNVPVSIALSAHRAKSRFRSGAMADKQPNCTPILEKFAKPAIIN